MNLICFPTYCAGAIVTDLLNGEKSNDEENGTISNLNSSKLKIPFNKNNTEIWYRAFFEKKVKNLNLDEDVWVGTHCWPTEVDMSIFSKVLVISTESKMSRVYRLMRIYFLFEGLHKRYNFTDDKLIDIEKKLGIIDFNQFKFDFSKQYSTNITNIDFDEIVEFNNNFVDFIKKNSNNYLGEHFIERSEYWKSTNNFLYDRSIVEIFLQRYEEYEKMQSN